jgi:hypothetical protein
MHNRTVRCMSLVRQLDPPVGSHLVQGCERSCQPPARQGWLIWQPYLLSCVPFWEVLIKSER